jgi:hypothetical protein
MLTVVSTIIVRVTVPIMSIAHRDLSSPKVILVSVLTYGYFKGCYHFNRHLRELRMSTPVGSPPLSRFVHDYKSYTAFSMNLALMWPVYEVG